MNTKHDKIIPLKCIGVFSLLAASLLWLTGCNQAKARAGVMAEFPGSEVVNVPDEPYLWIIRRPDGSVWYCFNASGGAGIDHVEILPPPTRPTP